jgi:hypothetical protein
MGGFTQTSESKEKGEKKMQNPAPQLVTTTCHWRVFLLREDGAVLLLRREFDPVFPNHWDLLGDRLKTRLDSFVPETVLLKMGIVARDTRRRTIVHAPHGQYMEAYHLTAYAVMKHLEVLQTFDPSQFSGSHVSEIRWMTPQEMESELLVPSVSRAMYMLPDCFV